ncbi:hypothetical protein HYV64_00435 [Candidatus Shapirobacteria bacterium]|nr:hypothetical protein [Candidatus Shapirobacteria bacterium]
MKRTFLVQMMEKYYEYFHLRFGLLSLLITLLVFPQSNFLVMLFLAVLASFLPDFDHVLAIFIYARSTSYSTSIRHHLSHFDFPSAIEYIRKHQKFNHFILSHNLLTPFAFFLLYIFCQTVFPKTIHFLSLFCPPFCLRSSRRSFGPWPSQSQLVSSVQA